MKNRPWLLLQLSYRLAVCLVALCMLLGAATVVAQSPVSFGLFAAYGSNLHKADFRAFPGVPNCCPRFESGSGSGFAFAARARMSLGEMIAGELRLGYDNLSGTLIRRESTTVAANQPAVFEHRVDSRLSDLSIEPLIGLRVIGPVHVYAGAKLALPVISTFGQQEVMLEPQTGTFPGGSRVRNEVVDAPIPGAAKFGTSVVAGAQAELPINVDRTIMLVPEVSYVMRLTSAVSNIYWQTNQLRIGASIVWAWNSKVKPVVAEPARRVVKDELVDTVFVAVEPSKVGFAIGAEQITELISQGDQEIVVTNRIRRSDTIRIARSATISAEMVVTGLNADGAETPSFMINVEEFASTIMNPLLSYVFFEEGQFEVPERYHRIEPSQVSSFSEEYVNSSEKLPTYYHLLNIVGSRLRRKPKATIELVGCNANVGVELANRKLSSLRAEEVRRYLMNVWGISQERIEVRSRDLPDRAANSQSVDGAQENRRVEILCNDATVLAPVISNDTSRSVSPPSVRLRAKVYSDRSVVRWRIVFSQGQNVLKTFSGSGSVPRLIDWNIQEEQSSHPHSSLPISYRLEAFDADSNRAEVSGQLDVEVLTIVRKRNQGIADKAIDRFSLILFDVRSADIGEGNARIVDLIKPYIKSSSSVTLLGLTDRLGNAEQNQLLAERRSQSVARALGLVGKGTVRGIGNSEMYAPLLPEGRMYTRTVDVVIETPIGP